MEIPKRRRQNIVGIKYVKGVIIDDHYEQIIISILGLRDEDVLKIEELSYTRFILKLEQDNYERICRDHAYKFIELDEESVIMLEDISSYTTEVRIHSIPLDITQNEVLAIFNLFGSIKRFYYRGKPGVRFFQRRETGRMTILMEINDPIPSSLFIRDTNSYIHINYAGQPITCNT